MILNVEALRKIVKKMDKMEPEKRACNVTSAVCVLELQRPANTEAVWNQLAKGRAGSSIADGPCS